MTKICLKNEKNVINALIILGIKMKKAIKKHVYKNNIIIKTKRTPIFGRSGCGKPFLMLSLLKNKNPDGVYKICKTDSQNQSDYLNQSSEILPLENNANKTIVFDDMLGSKEAKDIDAFLNRGRHQNFDIYYIFQTWYKLPKNTIRFNCSRIMLFPQTIRDNIKIYNKISGLRMCFSEWRYFWREVWPKKYNYFQIGKEKNLDDKYSIKNQPGLETVAVPEATAL